MIPSPKVIDLYHLDTVSDFLQVLKAGIHGIIHKATQGLAFVDSCYKDRKPKAIEAGLLWGAYHWIKKGDPEGQAEHFLNCAQPDQGMLLAVDHEDTEAPAPLPELIVFMKAVEVKAKRKPVLYSGFLIKEQIEEASEEEKAYLASCRLWLSQYVRVGMMPTWPKIWKSPWLHQYSDGLHGQAVRRIPGIDNPVDLNSFAGTDKELAAQWAGA